ncbi:MAG: NYN domain-containing protein [Bauldia sp.]
MNADNRASVTKLALLIDGDNVNAAFMPIMMREAAKHGAVAVRRIYGQFASGRMKSWQQHIADFDLTPVNVSPLTRGKNATDMKLVIEAMDMLHGRQLDGVCIASSDGDFTPLAARIRANALAVFGFGAKKAPEAYKKAFDRFYECDTLLAAEKKPAPRKAPPPPKAVGKPPRAPSARPSGRATGHVAQQRAPKPPIPTVEILSAIDETRESDGWSHLGIVGKTIRKTMPDFSAKKHGHGTMKRLVLSMSGVEAKTMPDGAVFVRRKGR